MWSDEGPHNTPRTHRARQSDHNIPSIKVSGAAKTLIKPQLSLVSGPAQVTPDKGLKLGPLTDSFY